MKVEDALGEKVAALRAIKIQPRRVVIIACACNFLRNFSRARRKLLTKLHSLKAPLLSFPMFSIVVANEIWWQFVHAIC